MRLGILADIHEDVAKLTLALRHFRREGVERVVLLGDVFDTGKRLRETVALLAGAGAVGVWGNHDLGLCHETGGSGPGAVRRAGTRLHGHPAANRLELEGCLNQPT